MGSFTEGVRESNFGKGDAEVGLLTLETEFSGVDNGSPKFVSQFHELRNILVPACRGRHLQWIGRGVRDSENDQQGSDDLCN
jgi:hypothetical protein